MAEDGRNTVPGAPPAALMAALRRLLRPLVRALIAQGVTYPLFCGLLKELYVDVAANAFPVDDRPPTDSRVHLLTGIHRKDVRRLRGAARAGTPPPPPATLHAQIIGVWLGTPPFADDAGHPRPLARQRGAGAGPSFDDLVEAVSKDIRPRAVLDEWQRLGLATLDGDQVRLDVEAFVPREGFDDLAHYFGRNLHDHMAAAAHNLLGGQPPFVERSVHYDGLTPDSVATLERLAERKGMDALLAVNRAALARAEADAGAQDATQRVNFGIYVFGTRGHSGSPASDDGEED